MMKGYEEGGSWSDIGVYYYYYQGLRGLVLLLVSSTMEPAPPHNRHPHISVI